VVESDDGKAAPVAVQGDTHLKTTIWITSNLNSQKETMNYQGGDDDTKFCDFFGLCGEVAFYKATISTCS
jgi:hypothetical protein